MSTPWGVWFEPTRPVRRIVELARMAETEGASVCLVADEGTDRDVYVTLTAVLLSTERMTVGPAITNPFSRHPVATTAAIATLAEMAPGRVWHGLGVGGSRVMAPMQLAPSKPFTALKEAVELNLALLTGRPVGPAHLPWATGPIPLAMAGRGPRTQALAAEHADWVILSAAMVKDLPATAARLRGPGHARVAWSAYLAFSPEDRRRVLHHFTYMAIDAPPDIRRAVGLDDDTAERVRSEMLAGRLGAAADLLPEALVDIYAVSGTPEECAATIGRLRPHFDLFLLPLNDEATDEDHLRISAQVLRTAGG
jgi:5,10-methylenetetrahydromethanopterin reductase